MGMVLQRGYEDQRGLVSKSDESDESDESKSERRLEGLGAMEVACAKRRLCVWWGWGNYF